jgi:hypothetical protein
MGQDGWYVMPGKLVNGREIDVFRDGAPLDWAKPAHVADTYADTRWRKYMLNLWLTDGAANRLWYARYLTGRWNATHSGGEQLETFKIIFMRQDTTADGVRPDPTPVQIWEHWCFK